MCIICASPAGVDQPTQVLLRRMFQQNPHGAGYMTARNGAVELHKGYMSANSLIQAVHSEHFTAADPVVYHFRISTQAGITPAMTHPFPLTHYLKACTVLDAACSIGVAHNGIIPLTSDRRDREYSDTAHFIAEFMSYFVRTPKDLHDPGVLGAISRLTGASKWALMDSTGYIATVGHFIEHKGLLFSNNSFQPQPRQYSVFDYEGE